VTEFSGVWAYNPPLHEFVEGLAFVGGGLTDWRVIEFQGRLASSSVSARSGNKGTREILAHHAQLSFYGGMDKKLAQAAKGREGPLSTTVNSQRRDRKGKRHERGLP
jgi:hypothetical protein